MPRDAQGLLLVVSSPDPEAAKGLMTHPLFLTLK